MGAFLKEVIKKQYQISLFPVSSLKNKQGRKSPVTLALRGKLVFVKRKEFSGKPPH